MNAVLALIQGSAPVLTVNDIALTFAGICFLYFARELTGGLKMLAKHQQTIHGDNDGKGVLADVERLFEWRRKDSDGLTEMRLTLGAMATDVRKIERWTEEHDKKDDEMSQDIRGIQQWVNDHGA